VKDGLNMKQLSGFWWMERWTDQITLDQ
jgi:hypothetical protein